MCTEIGDFLGSYILLVEYPGYSIFKGSPSQENIENNSIHVWNYVTKVLNFRPQDVVILGRSIGTGPSLDLCTKVQPSMLCLISPFTSIKNVTRDNYGSLACGFVKERFDNKNKMKKVQCPVLFVHGKEDSLISYKDSRTLYGMSSF